MKCEYCGGRMTSGGGTRACLTCGRFRRRPGPPRHPEVGPWIPTPIVLTEPWRPDPSTYCMACSTPVPGHWLGCPEALAS